MKKTWIVGLLCLFLTGCGAETTFETIADEYISAVMASPAEIAVQLPEEAIAPVLEGEGQQLYLCEDYEILLENRASGDLQETIRHLTGFDEDALTVVKTSQDSIDRYEFVWTCAGEEGQRLGRAVILDDGNYHYCLSVVRDAEITEGSQIHWREVFASFTLV